MIAGDRAGIIKWFSSIFNRKLRRLHFNCHRRSHQNCRDRFFFLFLNGGTAGKDKNEEYKDECLYLIAMGHVVFSL